MAFLSRVNVGYIGEGRVAHEYAKIGQNVFELTDLTVAPSCMLILIETPPDEIEPAAERLAPFIKPTQVIAHTALEHGTQVLDPVEIEGAHAATAHRIYHDFWVTSGAGRIAELVIGMFIEEIGGNPILINDVHRPALLAAQRMRALELELRTDALNTLTSILPAIKPYSEDFLGLDERPLLSDATPTRLQSLFSALHEFDPAAAQLFADLERRRAVRAGDADAELWAMGKRPQL